MSLYEKFRAECPIIARLPIVRFWAFGHFAKGYVDEKAKTRACILLSPFGSRTSRPQVVVGLHARWPGGSRAMSIHTASALDEPAVARAEMMAKDMAEALAIPYYDERRS